MTAFAATSALSNLISYMGLTNAVSAFSGVFPYIKMFAKYKPTDGSTYGITAKVVASLSDLPACYNNSQSAWTYNTIAQSNKKLTKFVGYDHSIGMPTSGVTMNKTTVTNHSSSNFTYSIDFLASSNIMLSLTEILTNGGTISGTPKLGLYCVGTNSVIHSTGSSEMASIVDGSTCSVTMSVSGWTAQSYNIYPFIYFNNTYYTVPTVNSASSIEVTQYVAPIVFNKIWITGYNGSVHVGDANDTFTLTCYAQYTQDGVVVRNDDITSSVTWNGYETYFNRSGSTFSGKAEGTANIYASWGTETSTSISCVAYVNHVSSVSLNKSSTTITRTGTETLTATVNPANADNKTVSWSSSDSTIASVNSSGTITANKAGSCTITVTTQDGGKTATCSVTVNPIHVTSVSLNTSGISLNVGGTQTLVATVSPSNADDTSVSWSSSNAGVATVNSSGVVTAIAGGSATITVTTTDGGKTATCSVAVSTPVTVTGIVISGYGGAVAVGGSVTLHVYYTYSNGTTGSTDYAANTTWSNYGSYFSHSGNNGVFYGENAGSCYIHAEYNGYTADQYAAVSTPSVSIVNPPASLTVGNSGTLTASTSGLANYTLEWSSNSGAVSINSSTGAYTAVANGSATITLKAKVGGVQKASTTCNISVSGGVVSVQSVTIVGSDQIQTGRTGAAMYADYYPSNATLASSGAFAWSCNSSSVTIKNPSSQTCRVNSLTEQTVWLTVVVTDSQGHTASNNMQITFSNNPQ